VKQGIWLGAAVYIAGYINKAIKETKKKVLSEKADESDMKSKAKILKAVIKDSALKASVNLSEK
jgi:hypothetical protein